MRLAGKFSIPLLAIVISCLTFSNLLNLEEQEDI
jgi:hypothetical protein